MSFCKLLPRSIQRRMMEFILGFGICIEEFIRLRWEERFISLYVVIKSNLAKKKLKLEAV